MAVETATELEVFFSADDFGVTATYTPLGGSSSSVKGIYDHEFYEADAGGTVGFAIEQPIFTCRTSDVVNAAEGDAIVINSTNYTIRVVRDDGTGVTVLALEED
jgi:hypothetical protein